MGVALALLFLGFVVLVLGVGYLYGRAETEAYYEWKLAEKQETIEALTPVGVSMMPTRRASVVVADVEPESLEDVFNRAYAHCERCHGAGHVNGVLCPCADWSPM